MFEVYDAIAKTFEVFPEKNSKGNTLPE